ncbi:MAG: hypothetical protein ACK5HS_01020 [Mycoplasmatales bacterium]
MKKNILIALIFLLVVLFINFILFHKTSYFYHGVPNIEFNQVNNYILFNDKENTESILVSTNSSMKDRQYIILDNVYTNVLVHENGLLLFNDKDMLCMDNEEGNLVNSTCKDIKPNNISTTKLEHTNTESNITLEKTYNKEQDFSKLPYNFNIKNNQTNLFLSFDDLKNNNLINSKEYNPIDFDNYSNHSK